ncbi:hypothetical protein QLH51_06380 [Sphingomonas sp. 2R-10]|uniref:hypothetical protein n=1 Tax=Sphingomonas sp. 2R-10 TaxID=3045148 RepID=UPI000F76BFDC|nr:hypothetical protein [Sphingomonas sp. 2R-10]MDJ0276423.1 hypothetical protein [Sphingomonas sp. 2R-10]
MTRFPLTAALLTVLACTCSVPALGSALATAPAATVDPAAVLAARTLDLATIGQLYDRALLADAVGPLMARVESATRTGDARSRARAQAVRAALLWRGGDLPGARAAAAAAAALDPNGDVLLLGARLADAAGDVDLLGPYRAAQAAGAGGDALALRVAVLRGLSDPSALAAYGRTLPADRARPVAVALGVLGDPAAALTLFRPATGGPGAGPDLLRVAEWALVAGDRTVARERAWQAYRALTTIDDRRYALALLTEAYRDGGDLAGAHAFLTAQPQDADIRQMRLNLLLELGRNDEAVAMASAPGAGALRERLPAILDLAGNRAESIAEYGRLIAAQPHDPRWYVALAAIYMQDGREAEARGVFDRLRAANRTNVPVLIDGARQMIAMGLSDAAIAMIAGVANGPGGMDARRFLFDTYVAQGDVARAGEQLQAMRAGVPAGSPALAQIAEGYAAIGRRDDAIATFLSMERPGRPLGYDQQVRLADLLVQADRQDEALVRLRGLLPVTELPARRSLIETRIVEVANASGNTDAIATELERRLDTGTLSDDQISLLMALRLSQQRYDQAVAAMRRFVARTGGGEAARLRQLIPVYARMNKQAELAAALERLSVIDPANRATYLRNRILTAVGEGGNLPAERRIAEIDRLLAELGKAEGAGVATHAFRAGIYGMADLDDRALAQARAAYAAAPGDADALAQLIAAMQKAGKVREAIAMLQFEGEVATSTRRFVGVLDGLLDGLVGADPVVADVALDWARRHAIERLALAGADPGLIGRIADLADARSDADLQLRALDASLPAAGEQRASVLRQLVTLTAGSSVDGEATVFGDVRRRIVYGRRLLALQRLFPPAFYGELGEAMLSVGDRAGAQGAFAMMNGIGNVFNVDAISGEAYARRGYTDAALRTLVRAMLRDRNNLDLVVKASILREQKGQGALAAPWYWRSLRAVIARQPVLSRDAAPDNQVDIERVVPNLVEGLLLTMPSDPATQTAVPRELRAMLDDAAARIAGRTPLPLADYGRLRLIVQIGRQIAAARGDTALAGAIDAVVARLPGAAPAATDGAPGDPLADLLRQARDTDDVSLEVATMLATGDAGHLRRMIADTMRREEAGRAKPTPFGPSDGAGSFILLLADLVERLPPDQVRDLLLEPLQASRFREDILFALLNVLPDRYALLQKIAGRPLLTDDELVRVAVERSDGGTGFTLRGLRQADARPFAWIAALPPERQLALYEGLVARAENGGPPPSLLALEARRDLLVSPLDPALRQRLLAVMRRDIAIVRDREVDSSRFILSKFLVLDADPGNRAALLEAAKTIAARYRDAAAMPALLSAWYANDRPTAYRLLLTLAQQSNAAQFEDFSADLTKRYFAEQRQARIDAFMNASNPTVEEAQRFYTEFVATSNEPNDRVIVYYRKLLAIDPNNQTYIVNLLWKLWPSDKDAYVALLTRYLRDHPDNRGVATVLAFTELERGRAAQAQAVATANGFSLDDPSWVTRLLNRAAQRSGTAPDPSAMFGSVYAAFEQSNPDAPVVVALQKRSGAAARRATGSMEEQAVSQFVQEALERPETAAGALRSLWRRSAVPGAESSGWSALTREAVVAALDDALFTGPEAARLRVIMARADVSAELEAYLAVLDPSQTAIAARLYTWLVDGIVGRGGAAARLARLLPGLVAGPIPVSDLRLAVRLADRTDLVLDPAQRQALMAQLDTATMLSVRDRIAAARVLGRSGDVVSAGAMLRAATLQLLYSVGQPDQADAKAIAGALTVWSDRAAARTTYDALAKLFADRRLAATIAPDVTLPHFDATVAAPSG